PRVLRSFLFHTPPPTDTSPLSLHDALPISATSMSGFAIEAVAVWPASSPPDEKTPSPPSEVGAPMSWSRFVGAPTSLGGLGVFSDRKSTRLNSSHVEISYAVFCLKKKKNKK